jgi:hypothetical protein
MLLVALVSPAARRAALPAPPYSRSSIVVGRCETARPRSIAIVDPQRQRLIRQAFRLEWVTIGWMAIEAAVAVASGIAARSITLVAFGLDSVIELASAGVLVWRLSTELKFGR